MFISIFKNVLLIIILILILHFLIRNKLSDMVHYNKRRYVNEDTKRFNESTLTNESTDDKVYVISEKQINDDSIVMTKTTTDRVEEYKISEQKLDKIKSVTDSGSGMVGEAVMTADTETFVHELTHNTKKAERDKCDLSCEMFNKPKPLDSEASKLQSNMKELYDFVYSSENQTNNDTDIDKYFQPIGRKVAKDTTEIDLHHSNVILDTDTNNYKYEVIGKLGEDKVDWIEGIDSMEMSNYSNL